MPIIDYNSQLYTEWINSDMRQLGAQLNPLGEMHIFDFFMEVSGDIAKQRSRLSGVQAEIVMFVMSFCIFGRNLAITSKMTIQRPRNMISWCCLILLFWASYPTWWQFSCPLVFLLVVD
ncbi:hypothetical protein BDF19DRAFT_419490 [Syncephalis fuscata]|nr:hypothetical protein BDF19DRAFT_419490 [Syncephalis fuscata]